MLREFWNTIPEIKSESIIRDALLWQIPMGTHRCVVVVAVVAVVAVVVVVVVAVAVAVVDGGIDIVGVVDVGRGSTYRAGPSGNANRYLSRPDRRDNSFSSSGPPDRNGR